MVQRTFRRFEKKILMEEEKLPALTAMLSRHADADPYNVGEEPYEINNLYFDDECGSVIRHSVSSPVFKEKLRVRSYGVPKENDPVFLELKKKFAGEGNKRRAVLLLSQAREFLRSGEVPEGLPYLDTRVLREINFFRTVNRAEPRVFIGYLRRGWFDREERGTRITVDTDILYRRTDLRLEAGRFGTPLLPEGKVLLELKLPEAVPLWVNEILRELDLRFTSFSKYGNVFREETASNAARQANFI